jgi:Uri superfamily endonuclease
VAVEAQIPILVSYFSIPFHFLDKSSRHALSLQANQNPSQSGGFISTEILNSSHRNWRAAMCRCHRIGTEVTMPFSHKGTYIFFSLLRSTATIRINQSGKTHRFQRGWYAYIGSAFGRGGLKSRLNRHYQGHGKGPWQIDFFRQGVHPHGRAWVSYQDRSLEAQWSAVFQLMTGVSVPVTNFGNSDDRGPAALKGVVRTHLFQINRKPKLAEFQSLMDAHFSLNEPLIEISLPL